MKTQNEYLSDFVLHHFSAWNNVLQRTDGMKRDKELILRAVLNAAERCGWRISVAADLSSPGYQTIIYVDTPEGQVSLHVRFPPLSSQGQDTFATRTHFLLRLARERPQPQADALRVAAREMAEREGVVVLGQHCFRRGIWDGSKQTAQRLAALCSHPAFAETLSTELGAAWAREHPLREPRELPDYLLSTGDSIAWSRARRRARLLDIMVALHADGDAYDRAIADAALRGEIWHTAWRRRQGRCLIDDRGISHTLTTR